jgi:hypothetical protein
MGKTWGERLYREILAFPNGGQRRRKNGFTIADERGKR